MCGTKLIDLEKFAVSSGSDSDCTDQSEVYNSSVPNLVSTKPVLKKFTIVLCNFGYYAKEITKKAMSFLAYWREVLTTSSCWVGG